MRLADFETLLKPFSGRILELFTKFSKENNATVRENFLHYSSVALRRCGQEMPMFFQSLFSIGFHQMQTDIKTGYVALVSLGQMVETQLRLNMALVNDSRRAQIVKTEFIELFLLKEEKLMKDVNVTITALELVKTLLILDQD